MVEKSPNAFRTISEVSDALEVPAHVLRFWESKFNQIKPVKRGGGRRYYRPTDLDLIRGIRDLLYSEGLTIKGVQKVLREKGVRHVMEAGSLADVRADDVEDDQLWDEPNGAQLEQPAPKEKPKKPELVRDDDQLFELAESPAPAPKKKRATPEAVPSKPKRSADRLVPEHDDGIRSLFDDPPPSPAAQQAIEEDELITKVAEIAKDEQSPSPVQAEADSGTDKKAEIARVLGKLERLRDKMKNH